jgi:hypothetical protein
MYLEISFGAFRKRDCLGGLQSLLCSSGVFGVNGIDALLTQLTTFMCTYACLRETDEVVLPRPFSRTLWPSQYLKTQDLAVGDAI